MAREAQQTQGYYDRNQDGLIEGGGSSSGGSGSSSGGGTSTTNSYKYQCTFNFVSDNNNEKGKPVTFTYTIVHVKKDIVIGKGTINSTIGGKATINASTTISDGKEIRVSYTAKSDIGYKAGTYSAELPGKANTTTTETKEVKLKGKRVILPSIYAPFFFISVLEIRNDGSTHLYYRVFNGMRDSANRLGSVKLYIDNNLVYDDPHEYVSNYTGTSTNKMPIINDNKRHTYRFVVEEYCPSNYNGEQLPITLEESYSIILPTIDSKDYFNCKNPDNLPLFLVEKGMNTDIRLPQSDTETLDYLKFYMYIYPFTKANNTYMYIDGDTNGYTYSFCGNRSADRDMWEYDGNGTSFLQTWQSAERKKECICDKLSLLDGETKRKLLRSPKGDYTRHDLWDYEYLTPDVEKLQANTNLFTIIKKYY